MRGRIHRGTQEIGGGCIELEASCGEQAGLAPGLRDEVATVIRALHVRLGFDEGGLR